jgi:hypothetical protein
MGNEAIPRGRRYACPLEIAVNEYVYEQAVLEIWAILGGQKGLVDKFNPLVQKRFDIFVLNHFIQVKRACCGNQYPIC